MKLSEARAMRLAIMEGAKHLSDAVAVTAPLLFPRWRATDSKGEPVEYEAGERLYYGGKLYKVKEGMSHTAQADWTPDVAVSLYERIEDAHAGTEADPIPYEGNMALENGLYYVQDGVVYKCTRDTVNAVYAALRDLVGLYVEEVSKA